ncbi:hypothetical protein [Reichenbachiella sp.]|uniref:hypothetical protein n=1 Tax=Reichenbachiella sp. TaxID=2184521 RepID=UPI003BAE3B14
MKSINTLTILLVFSFETFSQVCDCNQFSGSGITTGGTDTYYWRINRAGSGEFNESLLFSTKRTGTEDTKMILSKNGELGIGTTSLTSGYQLTVNGNVHTKGTLATSGSGITTGGIGTYYWRINRAGSGEFNESLLFSTKRTGTEDTKMILSKNGELGIGTTSLTSGYQLTVNGNVHTKGTLATSGSGITTGGIGTYYWRINRAGSGEFNESLLFSTMRGSGTEDVKMILSKNGELGLGTTDTFGYQLAVNGTIGAKEVKVESTSEWPDYVFEEHYDLRSLEETEKFITKNKHLPEIPSEVEVTENGIKLGEMNAKFLQKIEELTLYLIEQNKELKSANMKIEKLQKEVSALKNE